MYFSPLKKVQKKDYFVMTRQAGGKQHLFQPDMSAVLP